jgi:glycosyltransferase involved in cell wall biosynthesis
VLQQAGSYGNAVVLPDLGDLSVLVREEGYVGEFFDPASTESLASAIEKIITQEDYRVELGKANYKAACSLPMSEITRMYVEYFKSIKIAKKEGFELDLPKKVCELEEHHN